VKKWDIREKKWTNKKIKRSKRISKNLFPCGEEIGLKQKYVHYLSSFTLSTVEGPYGAGVPTLRLRSGQAFFKRRLGWGIPQSGQFPLVSLVIDDDVSKDY
jgi:hypothetical protein